MLREEVQHKANFAENNQTETYVNMDVGMEKHVYLAKVTKLKKPKTTSNYQSNTKLFIEICDILQYYAK